MAPAPPSALRVESGELAMALYVRDGQDARDDVLVMRLATLRLAGSPAAVVDLLSRALGECFTACANGRQDVESGDPSGAGTQAQSQSLPPVTALSEVGGTLSRLAPRATAKPLGLDGGSSISDHLASAGGGFKTSFYLIRDEGVEGA